MTDYLDPEAPSPDPHASDRPVWTPVYMGEGKAQRCGNCSQTISAHDTIKGDPFAPYLCRESFLRLMDGDR